MKTFISYFFILVSIGTGIEQASAQPSYVNARGSNPNLSGQRIYQQQIYRQQTAQAYVDGMDHTNTQLRLMMSSRNVQPLNYPNNIVIWQPVPNGGSYVYSTPQYRNSGSTPQYIVPRAVCVNASGHRFYC